jgi:hypothetical protein
MLEDFLKQLALPETLATAQTRTEIAYISTDEIGGTKITISSKSIGYVKSVLTLMPIHKRFLSPLSN